MVKKSIIRIKKEFMANFSLIPFPQLKREIDLTLRGTER